ncbi:MAG TPA: pilus assembly PilX N-terminal domain-containing protein [Patescibacteria group bacterium]|nr:pilus assembly PilX N-terminal domain-containing protein [Patescibacteria group bacterium]
MSSIDAEKPADRVKEQGMVSIMVTMILMIVLSLIVIGFAQISRRNQRQQLDRQLSTQAFYAAESGINDAYKVINDRLVAGQSIPNKLGCPNTGVYAGFDNTLDTNANVEYSCLLIDATPASVQYGDIGSVSTVVPIKSADGNAISTLNIHWQAKDVATPITNCPTSSNGVFSTNANWQCGYGVLRVDLVPVTGNALTSETLRQTTMSNFIVPMRANGAAGPIAFKANATNANNRFGLACTNTDCGLTITGMNANYYYMRVTSIYKNVSLQMSGTTSAGNPLKFEGAQALIDSTGKAQDVLRRVQVRVPLMGDSKNALSDYAVQSISGLCKRFAVANNYFKNFVSTDQVANRGGSGGNPLCDPAL